MAVKKLKNLRQTHYASVRALLLSRKILSQLLTVHIVTRWSALMAVPTMLNFCIGTRPNYYYKYKMMLNNVTDFGCYRQKDWPKHCGGHWKRAVRHTRIAAGGAMCFLGRPAAAYRSGALGRSAEPVMGRIESMVLKFDNDVRVVRRGLGFGVRRLN